MTLVLIKEVTIKGSFRYGVNFPPIHRQSVELTGPGVAWRLPFRNLSCRPRQSRSETSGDPSVSLSIHGQMRLRPNHNNIDSGSIKPSRRSKPRKPGNQKMEKLWSKP
jgi:hypothetical protein